MFPTLGAELALLTISLALAAVKTTAFFRIQVLPGLPVIGWLVVDSAWMLLLTAFVSVTAVFAVVFKVVIFEIVLSLMILSAET